MLVHIKLIEREDAPETHPKALVNTIVSLAGDEAGSPEAITALLEEGICIVPMLHSYAVCTALINCGYDYDPRAIQPAIVDPGDDVANAAIPEKYTLKGVSDRLWAKGEKGTIDATFVPAYLTTFGGAKPADDHDARVGAVLLSRAIRCLVEGYVHPEILEAAGLGPMMDVSEADTQPVVTEEDTDESA